MSLFNNQASTTIESFDSNKRLAYGIFKNGLWRKIKTPLGHFTHKVKDLPDNIGLTKECEVAFEKDTSIPKIPYTIYFEILEFYKEIYKEIKSEVYTCIVWDKEAQDFYIHVPEQTVSGAEVKFENDDDLFQNPNLVPYCDIHSHNTMGAFFSAGDVKDEVGGRFYGVIGKINDEHAAHVFKVSYDRQFVDLKAEEVFDTETAKLHEHSDYTIIYDKVIENVKERPPVKVVATYQYPSYPFPTQPINRNNSIAVTGTVYDYDYDDLDPYSGYDVVGNNIASSYTKDITIGTSLANKKHLAPFRNFAYDFSRVFNFSITKQQDLINIYHSLTELILEECNVSIEETTLMDIISEVCSAVP